MTDEPYADPALRDALGSLLLDEPPAPPLVDDVARGRARQRRRRARAGAAAALAAVAVGAVAIAGLPRPASIGQPATSRPAVSSDEALDDALLRIEPFLLAAGWTVVADNRPTLPEGSDRAEMDLSVVRTQAAQDDDPLVTDVRLVTYASAPQRGYYLSDCTSRTCTSLPTVVDDCGVALRCATTQGALPKASAGRLDWGSLILDRTFRYAGSGQMVEVVIGADPATPTVAALGPEPFLDLATATALLDNLGNPFGVPAPATTGPACRDRDVKLIPAADPEYQRGRRSLVVEVHARNPQVRCTVTGTPELQLLGVDERPLPFTVVAEASSPAEAVLVTQERTPAARVVVSQPTCRSDVVTPASSLLLTLPGESVSTVVEVPRGLALSYCVGGAGDPGVTVTESPFLAVPRGDSATSAPTP